MIKLKSYKEIQSKWPEFLRQVNKIGNHIKLREHFTFENKKYDAIKFIEKNDELVACLTMWLNKYHNKTLYFQIISIVNDLDKSTFIEHLHEHLKDFDYLQVSSDKEDEKTYLQAYGFKLFRTTYEPVMIINRFKPLKAGLQGQVKSLKDLNLDEKERLLSHMLEDYKKSHLDNPCTLQSLNWDLEVFEDLDEDLTLLMIDGDILAYNLVYRSQNLSVDMGWHGCKEIKFLNHLINVQVEKLRRSNIEKIFFELDSTNEVSMCLKGQLDLQGSPWYSFQLRKEDIY